MCRGCGMLGTLTLDCPQLESLDATFCYRLGNNALAWIPRCRPPPAAPLPGALHPDRRTGAACASAAWARCAPWTSPTPRSRLAISGHHAMCSSRSVCLLLMGSTKQSMLLCS